MGCEHCKRPCVQLLSDRSTEQNFQYRENKPSAIPILDYAQCPDYRQRMGQYASIVQSTNHIMATNRGQAPLEGLSCDSSQLELPKNTRYLNLRNTTRGGSFQHERILPIGSSSLCSQRATEEGKKVRLPATYGSGREKWTAVEEGGRPGKTVVVKGSGFGRGRKDEGNSLYSGSFDHSKLVRELKAAIYDRYKVVDLLGRGAYGQVKKVVHKGNEKVFALKVLSRNRCEERENLAHEVEVLKKLVIPQCDRRTTQTSFDSLSSLKTNDTSTL